MGEEVREGLRNEGSVARAVARFIAVLYRNQHPDLKEYVTIDHPVGFRYGNYIVVPSIRLIYPSGRFIGVLQRGGSWWFRPGSVDVSDVIGARGVRILVDFKRYETNRGTFEYYSPLRDAYGAIVRDTRGEPLDILKTTERNETITTRELDDYLKQAMKQPSLAKQIGTALLRQLDRLFGRPTPRPQVEENIYEDMREAIRSFLVDKINEAYFRAAGRLEVDFEERVRVVLTSRLIPWMTLRGEEVIFTTEFVRELEPLIGDIGGLKSVAELLGWEYKDVKLGGEVRKVALVKLEDLIEFLT